MPPTPSPHVAILFATAQGSTRDIAEFICEELVSRGAHVELRDIEHAPDLTGIGTVIIGSAIHDMDLLPEANAYIRHNLPTLTAREVWLFTVGLGPALRGPVGRWAGRQIPRKVGAAISALHPREYAAFAGKYEREGVSWRARAMFRLLGGTRYGDLRDWDAVRRWAGTVADSLQLPQASAINTAHP